MIITITISCNDTNLHKAVEASLWVVDVARDVGLLHPLLKEAGVWAQPHLVLEAVTNFAF